MEITEGYKYYHKGIMDNESLTVELLKLPRTLEGPGEKLEYSRDSRGNYFFLKKIIYDSRVVTIDDFQEIEEIEYEIMKEGGEEASDTLCRLFSYFDDKHPVLDNLRRRHDIRRVIKKLGWETVYLDTDYPKPLLEILPWYISGGEILVTQGCVDYLKALSEEYKNREDKNSVWMKDGVDRMLEQIYLCLGKLL